MKMTQQILNYIEEHKQEAIDLLITLAKIPAPSNHEEKRAAFCKEWLEKQGAEGVYIDEALNVVYPVGCTDNNPVMVFMAHTDVVFPDTEELPLVVEDLMDVDYDGYVKERRGNTSLLLGKFVMSQYPRYDAERYGKIPWFEYTIVQVKIPALYENCKKRLIHEGEYYRQTKEGEYRLEQSEHWKAEEAYRLYDLEYK